MYLQNLVLIHLFLYGNSFMNFNFSYIEPTINHCGYLYVFNINYTISDNTNKQCPSTLHNI